MAAIVKTRFQLKNDIEANWRKVSNFSPLAGEIIIYLPDENYNYPRIKIGDGLTDLQLLPFLSASVNIKGHTTQEWQQIPNFIPEKNEIIIYTDKISDSQNIIPGLKIGDGISYGLDLPFIGDELSSILTSHINNSSIHVTAQEKAFWNNKLNFSEVVNEELILTRN